MFQGNIYLYVSKELYKENIITEPLWRLYNIVLYYIVYRQGVNSLEFRAFGFLGFPGYKGLRVSGFLGI